MAPRSERAAYIETEDTKGTIHPYIPEDVDSATRVPLTVWVEAVLGLPQERFSDWVRHITENEWCKDEIIYKNLIMFSNTHAEEDRHQPFGRIASRILELGREGLPGTDTCPIDEISIVKNSPKYLKCIPEHTGHGAKRTPDMLVIRRSRYEHLRKIKARAFDWSDVLTFIELKMWNTFLHKKFRAWRAERGLPELDRKTLLPVVPSKVGILFHYTHIRLATDLPDRTPLLYPPGLGGRLLRLLRNVYIAVTLTLTLSMSMPMSPTSIRIIPTMLICCGVTLVC